MRLLNLEVFQYRNFNREEIGFSPGTNLLVGRNGQGKTNLLEAIHILGYGRSFRTSRPRECIQHGRDECAVAGEVAQGGVTRRLQVRISNEGKKHLIHGKPAAVDEFIGNLHLLAFTSEHLGVIRGEPSDRRSFLDRAMVTLYPGHVRLLASYGRALKQRNRLLAQQRGSAKDPDDALVDSWTETLARDGARIAWNRARYVELMKVELPESLFGAETLRLHYVSGAARETVSPEAIEEQFRTRLAQSRGMDLRLGFTTAGPHRDELKIYLNGRPLAGFGSAGQQRSSLLSLYFAQMEIHRKSHGFYPVFLVDDVEAELDDLRLSTFVSYLSERTQTFLTTAKESLLPRMSGEIRRFEIHAGSVTGV